MNNVIFQGNLVDNLKSNTTQNGKTCAYGKIGVYNGKDNNGEQRQSMFFDIICFGRDAEIACREAVKGDPVIVSGRLEEDMSTSQKTGQTYMNKRIVCNNIKIVKRQQYQQAPQQYQQAPQQYQQAPQQPGNPW